MKKRIISLLLALSMMISLVPVSALAYTGGGIDLAAYASNEPLPDLVMNSNGTPNLDGIKPDSNGVYQGKNWTYQVKDGVKKLTLTSGEWNFSYTHPANGAGETLSEVKCIVQINEGATVTGGTFTKVVNNGVNDRENNIRVKGGTIEGGKFDCNVYNYGGTIKNGEFTHCWNDNLDDAKGTIEGGTFDSNGMSASVTNYGIISGGTFNDLVTSDWKGVIEKGTFNGIVSNYGSISGGYFLSADNEYDTDSKVSGGVFKTIPSKVEDTSNLYKIQFDSESGADTTNTLSVDNHDFGMTSVYVVGKDDTELTVTAKDKILTSVNNKANTIASSYSITFKLGEVKLDDEKEGNAYLLKLNAKIYNSELVIGTDGKPVTEGRKPYSDGVQGDGWEYNTKTETLTILTGHTERFAGLGVNNQLKVNVVVQNGATVEYGRFYKTVENHGTMSQARFCGNVTNTGNGTMKKCTFWDFTGNLTITNEGEMEECIVAKDVTMLTNNGKMIRSSVEAKTVQGNGTYDTCLLAKNYGIAGTHKVTTKNKTDKIMVRLVNDGNQCNAEVEETEVYFTGTPTLKVQIGKYDDGWTRIPLTNVNGDENYGFTLSRDSFYIFAVPANSDVILNDTVKHTLTVKDGTIKVGEEAKESPATLAENTEVTVTASAPKTGEHFAGWEAKKTGTDTTIALYGWSSNTIDLTKENLIFQMPTSNVTLTATYAKNPTYPLTITGGKITDNEATSGNFEQGKIITIVADVPAKGFAFVGWNALNGTTCPVFSSADKNTRTYKFEMPAEKVELEAVYEPTGSGELVLVNGVPDINNAIRRDVHENVTTYFGRGWEYRVSDETDPSKNLLLLTGENFVLDKNSSSDSLKCNLEIGEYTSVKGTIPLTQAVKIEGTVDGMYFDGAEVTVDTTGTVTNSILHNVTVTNNGNIKNCVSDTELPGAQALTEAGGATVTATLDGCAGEVSGTKLYFTGTPTLKVKVADGIVEKANDKPVGKADANGWYTVKAAEDDDGIVLTKGEKTTPNPDDQPKTYTVTVKGGTINNETEVKAEKDIKLTVDVDEKEVPEGMTFDVWSIRFPKGIEDTLTPSVKLHDPHMSFTMPEADITIEAQYRSAELPGEDDGPSALGTMATVAVGGAAAGILVWQGVSLGVDSYLQLNLPQGVAVPTNRRELVVLLWETAGKPETALPSLYSDLPAEEIELQKATRWAIDNGLVKSADDNDDSRFDPDRYVTKYDVFGAWLKLKKLMKL